MCRQDILFWINTFVMTLDPRNYGRGLKPKIPFNTYACQDRGIHQILDSIGRYDVKIPKSRTMGLTWMICSVYDYLWLFGEDLSFKVGSWKEKMVDDRGKPSTLMGKFDFINSHLPAWMLPPGFSWDNDRVHLELRNPSNGCIIEGESTNENFARSERHTSIFLDEFPEVPYQTDILAATGSVSDNRIFVGTYRTTADKFYELTHDPDGVVIQFHWSEHPIYAAGLYRSHDGTLEIVDQSFKFAPDYPFVIDGKLRSPWYDAEEKRRKNPQEMAREIDMNPEGAMYGFFGDTLKRDLLQGCREPRRIPVREVLTERPGDGWGDLWDRCRTAAVDVWCPLDPQGKPPGDRRYRMGVDVSQGTGASNSVICIVDVLTGEQVAEFAWPRIYSYELAHLAVSMARWFKGADEQGCQMIWERKGPGNDFYNRLVRIGYHHYYRRRNEHSESRKITDIPGWEPTPDNKNAVLGSARDAMRADPPQLIPRSFPLVRDELSKFIYHNGTVEHSGAISTDDASGARTNHGDRVVALSLAWWIAKDQWGQRPEPLKNKPGRSAFLDRVIALGLDPETFERIRGQDDPRWRVPAPDPR
jgi:hypothetical protein